MTWTADIGKVEFSINLGSQLDLSRFINPSNDNPWPFGPAHVFHSSIFEEHGRVKSNSDLSHLFINFEVFSIIL